VGGTAGQFPRKATSTDYDVAWYSLTKSDVGLGNVDNTADTAKPVSTAQQTALNLKADAARTITAGAGLTGGGDLTASRTLDVGAGTGITVAADTVGITPAGVTNALLATMPANTFKGNGTGSTAAPTDLTLVAVQQLLMTQVVASNLWVPIWPFANLSTVTLAPGQIRVARVIMGQACKTVQVEVTTLAATTFVRVAVYADSGGTQPGALLAQTADIDVSTAGTKSAALAIPAGPCWIAMQNKSTTNTPTMRQIVGSDPYLPGVDTPTQSIANAWQNTGQGTTLPDPFPMTGITRNAAMPVVFAQAT